MLADSIICSPSCSSERDADPIAFSWRTVCMAPGTGCSGGPAQAAPGHQAARPDQEPAAGRSGAVFAEQGFGRATVEDVCERAGYTRGAFYSNFASLDELFLALHTDRAALRHPEVAGALTVHRRALRRALIPVLRMALGPRGAAASNAQLDDVARAVIAVQDWMALLTTRRLSRSS